MSIKILDPRLVSRIAAGEVVERPASVVKELVENSLDAGASQITIEVRGGGTGSIRVTDNGVGIPAAEVGLAFERHATSKIGSLEDLEGIASLGFRGEALPSIASVAQVDMVTRAAGEEAGTHLSLEGGVVVSRGSQGRSQGTTVTVRNLFRKVPARLKFLKSAATENSRIAHVASQYALAFPEVRFAVSIDGKTALRTPGSGRLLDSITQVYGVEAAGSMVEVKGVEWEAGGTESPQVTGMIGNPSLARSSRGYLSFFVGRRWVSSRLLTWAVEEAYHGLLMVGKHPVAVINLALPPGEVDINIHPTKMEVKFHHERLAFAAVQKAVRQALVGQAPVPRITEVATRYETSARPGRLFSTPAEPVTGSSGPPPPAEIPRLSLPVLRVLGQLASKYIVAEGPGGLYLIDQHAAHERILFERIARQRAEQKIEVQGLLEPATFEVTPRQDTVLKLSCPDLAGLGFSIEPFGERTYLVRAVPALLYERDWEGMVRQLLDDLSASDKGDWRENMSISLACHSAIRAGQTLTAEEMRELIRQLEEADNPHTCPHGRPIMIHLSSGQLEKEFGRA
ncbi:MAG: DNA mismatch repair endonuclease MutL [Chloroflexota bacterium]